jgi:hypothetical protein
MNRARTVGLVLVLLGVVIFMRGSRAPTHSTVAMISGALFMAAGLLCMFLRRRPRLP